MANILLRSPYYIQVANIGAATAQLQLSVNGDLRYTINKDVGANGSALF